MLKQHVKFKQSFRLIEDL